MSKHILYFFTSTQSVTYVVTRLVVILHNVATLSDVLGLLESAMGAQSKPQVLCDHGDSTEKRGLCISSV
ncbi:MAG: hypothetical protein ABUK01_17690 [Leptospirales bacterium]